MNSSMLSNLRSFLIAIIILIGINEIAVSQCKEFLLGPKGDTFNCVDIRGMRQGKWINQIAPLRVTPGYEEEGEYVNDKKAGTWKLFSLQGDLFAVENYKYGQKDGLQQYYGKTGFLVREESWLARNPDKIYDTVDVYLRTNQVEKAVVKLDASTVPHGLWKEFDPSTKKLIRERYFILGKEDDGSGTANGLAQPNGGEEKKEEPKKEVIKPKEVLEFEKQNNKKKQYKIRSGQTGG